MSTTTAEPRPDVQAAARLLDIPFCPHDPTRNTKQARFLLWFGLEALYGGQAGGGKSDALLMAALQFIEVPGYAALLLRRRYTDLAQPGALMDRARDWFGPTEAVWQAKRYSWVFPSGATITFGYLHDEQDKYRYQSAEFQYIGVDELTQFSESQYRYMFSRLRRPENTTGTLKQVPLRMRGATNPGGRGHDWARRRFNLGTKRQRRHDRHVTAEDAAPPSKRRFFPASLEDNPFIDHEAYRASLAELDPITRARLEHGDWSVRGSDAVFNRQRFRIEPSAPDGIMSTVRYWDLAATEKGVQVPDSKRDPDYTAGALCSRTRDGLFVVHHVIRFRRNPSDVERIVSQTAERDGRDVPIRIEQEPGSSGKSLVSHYRRNVLQGHTVIAHPKGARDKVTMAMPWASRVAVGEVVLVDGVWIDDFLDEAEVFPSGGHDDQIDAVSGAYAVLTDKTGPGRVRVPGQ